MSHSEPDASLLACLLKLSAGDREAFLQRACAADPDLRRRLTASVYEAETASAVRPPSEPAPAELSIPSPPRRVPIRALEAALHANDSENSGTDIGPYKLLQKIGEGGFGVVWMAEQSEPIRRRVALKIVKVGMDTEEVIARFEAERQALALMEHPNIAHVFDAGATDSGRPFFVMELVRGVAITRYCDENRLSAEARLRLFITVCHAVQHAHHKGVIHRDLKPSNILVTLHDGVAVPKIIDFGIAKATKGRLTEKTLFTQFHTFIGTPAYTSPEQMEMSGLDVDTRSDIYSLGVLLYELLTGQPPFDSDALLKSGLEEMRRTIREIDPPTPSHCLGTLSEVNRTSVAHQRGTDAVKLSLLLRGDLDWIAMRCLEKDRARRYNSAAGLAADINRHLNDDPVEARPPSQAYRTKKFIRRHRLGVLASAAVTVSLFAGLITSSILFFRERSAHGRALSAEIKEHELRRQAEGAGASEVKRAARTALDLANQNLADGRVADGLAYLVYVARKDPKNATLAPRLASALTAHNFMLPRNAPFECGSRVIAVRFTADGRSIFVGTEDGAFRVFDAASGEIKREFRIGRTVILDGWDFPTDNDTVVGARFPNNTYGVYETESGRPKFTPLQLDPKVWIYPGIIGVGRVDHAVGLSSDGRWIHAGTTKEFWVWDAATGALRIRLTFVEEFIGDSAFSPDGTQLVLTIDNSVRRWSLSDGSPMPGTLTFEDPPPSGAALYGAGVQFSRDGRLLAVCDPNVGLYVFDAATGTRLHTLARPDSRLLPPSVTFTSPNRVFVQGALQSGSWDLDTGKFTAVPTPRSKVLTDVSFDAAGKRGLAVSSDGLMRIFELATSIVLAEPTWQQRSAFQAALSPDGTQVIAGTLTGAIHRFEISRSAAQPLVLPRSNSARSAGQRMPAPFLPERPSCLLLLMRDRAIVIDVTSGREVAGGFRYPESILPTYWSEFDYMVRSDLKFMVVQTELGERQSWELGADGIKQVTILKDAPPLPGQLSFSPSGDLVAITTRSEGVRAWNLRTGAPVGPAFRHSAPIMSVSPNFSPNGIHLALGTVDGGAMILDIATARPITTFKTRPLATYQAVRFSPDGARLITASLLNETQLWNVTTGEPISPVTHIMGSRSARFSPDGRWLMVTSLGTTTILNGQTGAVTGRTIPASGYPRFSADSGWLGTASPGGSAQIWDVPTGEPVTEPYRHPRQGDMPEFSSDGRFLKTENAHLYVWSVPPRSVGSATPPEWLLQLATICATKTVNDAGELADATAEILKIDALRRQIAALAADAPYAEWGRWILNDRADRSIAPGFNLTPEEADKLTARLAAATPPPGQ